MMLQCAWDTVSEARLWILSEIHQKEQNKCLNSFLGPQIVIENKWGTADAAEDESEEQQLGCPWRTVDLRPPLDSKAPSGLGISSEADVGASRTANLMVPDSSFPILVVIVS